MNRRDAIRSMTAAISLGAMCAKSVVAAEEAKTTGLGLVIYCHNLRQQAEKGRNPKANLFEPQAFLEHCHQLGAGGIQVPLGVLDPGQSRKLRQRADQYGMFVEGIVSPPKDKADLDRFEAEIRTAALVGALAVRTVAFPGRRYEFFDSAEQFRQVEQQARKSLELATPLVEKHRVRLALENHKDHRAAPRVKWLQEISSEWVGACVDVGNNFALLEEPVAVVEALAPWAFSVHLKDQAVQEYEDGFLFADVPLGQGFLDLAKMVATVREAKPDVRFTLELITRDPLKVPCLTEKYWATFADVPGSDLARTLRAVRQHRAERLPEVSSLAAEQQVALEDANIRASLAYARERLGVQSEKTENGWKAAQFRPD